MFCKKYPMSTAKAKLKELTAKDKCGLGKVKYKGKCRLISSIANENPNAKFGKFTAAELSATFKKKPRKKPTRRSKCIDPEDRINPCTTRLQYLQMDNEAAPTMTPCVRDYKKLEKAEKKFEKDIEAKKKKITDAKDKLRKIIQKEFLAFKRWLEENEVALDNKKTQMETLLRNGNKSKIDEKEYDRLCKEIPPLEKNIKCVKKAMEVMRDIPNVRTREPIGNYFRAQRPAGPPAPAPARPGATQRLRTGPYPPPSFTRASS